jgi:NitT/TauT family transport system ATP-binding protein
MTDPTTDAAAEAPLLELKNVDMDFTQPGRGRVRLLDGIQLTVKADELVAVLGPAGSGKSALARVAAGLLQPSAGTVAVRGQALRGVSSRVGVVFQTPALFPWLTVQANVELGLEKLPVARERKEEMVAWALDRLGLEGFEEAYPRELSPGLKVRVALARALAAQPEVLVLDDPFDGLDVLTAEGLRNELVSLWQHTDVNPKAILLVTHDIQEAVALASRVMLLSGSPSKLSSELPIPLSYPRDLASAEAQDAVNRLHDFLTNQILPEDAPVSGGKAGTRVLPLPRADLAQILGLLEALDDRGGRLDIFDFAAETHRGYQSMVVVVNAAELLGLVATPKDQAELTDKGRQLLKADVNGRKALLNLEFQRLRLFADFITRIEASPEHALRREEALEHLQSLFPSENAGQQLNTMVAWARYAELFGYSSRRGLLYLDRTFVQEGAELREVKRAKPGPRPRVRPQETPVQHETTPLPEAVPEPEAPSEDALRSAEAAGHHVAGGDLSREQQGSPEQNGDMP